MRRVAAVSVVAGAVFCCIAAPAFAHVITQAQLRTAAGKAAAAIKRDTGASSTRDPVRDQGRREAQGHAHHLAHRRVDLLLTGLAGAGPLLLEPVDRRAYVP